MSDSDSEEGCLHCQSTMHLSKDCPQQRAKRTYCNNCGLVGHKPENCTESASPTPSGLLVSLCSQCGSVGHNRGNCLKHEPFPATSVSESIRHCPENIAHKTADPPNRKPTREPSKEAAEEPIRESTKEPIREPSRVSTGEPPSDSGPGRGLCFKCGGRGHFAMECTSAAAVRPRQSSASATAFRTKKPDHQQLAELCDKEIKSRNPVGENFHRLGGNSVIVSDTSFHDRRLKDFTSECLNPNIMKTVRKTGYVSWTPIQAYAIPIILSGKNLLASAQTGCGKTAAFLLPILHILAETERKATPGNVQAIRCLIVTPTRELSRQITDDATKFACFLDISVKPCYGRTDVFSELRNIRTGCHILVATMGRLLDHLEKGHISLEKLRFLVFDEADKMLNADFQSNIDLLMQNLKKVRARPQTMTFSATYPEAVIGALHQTIPDQYVKLDIGVIGTVNEDVQQQVLIVPEKEKEQKLLALINEDLKTNPKSKIIVFVRTRIRAAYLEEFMFKNSIHAQALHGEMEQFDRERSVSDFQRGKRPVLIATLLANRGLDIRSITHVIIYDLPTDIEEYVNCTGRTGRVGNCGRATSFFDPKSDLNIAQDLQLKLDEAGVQNIPDFFH